MCDVELTVAVAREGVENIHAKCSLRERGQTRVGYLGRYRGQKKGENRRQKSKRRRVRGKGVHEAEKNTQDTQRNKGRLSRPRVGTATKPESKSTAEEREGTQKKAGSTVISRQAPLAVVIGWGLCGVQPPAESGCGCFNVRSEAIRQGLATMFSDKTPAAIRPMVGAGRAIGLTRQQARACHQSINRGLRWGVAGYPSPRACGGIRSIGG